MVMAKDFEKLVCVWTLTIWKFDQENLWLS